MNEARFPHVKSPTRRAARPGNLKRRSTHGDSLLRATKPDNIDQIASEPERREMAASFLQFCATCEKQITTPCNSILYCSEACRRKDSTKPLSMSNTGISPVDSPLSSGPCSPRPILPSRIVTSTSYISTPFLRIPPDLHDSKPDLDPTEWKPKLNHRAESEAYRYLSQFHRSTTAINELNEKRERPPSMHASTTSMTTSVSTPSLANTPTTTESSWSTTGGYEFTTRPLQPRHNPIYSASAGMAKGIDLVTPHVPPVPEIAASVPDDVHDWGKRLVLHDGGSGKDGLGALFGGATPKQGGTYTARSDVGGH